MRRKDVVKRIRLEGTSQVAYELSCGHIQVEEYHAKGYWNETRICKACKEAEILGAQ